MTRSYFECQPCNRQFSTDEALQSHLQHSSRHFCCNPCNRVFSSEEALESHLSTAKAHKWCYTCDPCNEVFNSEEALESHLSSSKAHTWCYTCNQVFNSEVALNCHLLTSEAHTWCYTCNRGFISAGALQSHMRNAVLHRYASADSTNPQKLSPQIPSPQKPIPQKPSTAPQATHCCGTCNISFKEPFQLREHNYAMHTERDIKQRDIKCWGCPKTFTKYSTLLTHLETETCITTRVELDQLAIKCEDSKDFVIPGCEAHLRTGDRKNYISRAVFKKGSNRFGCSDCDHFFANDAGLASHMASSAHHPLAYQCAGCQSQHADLSSLLAHVEGSGCTEGVTYGTGSIGKLLRYLWQNLRS